MVQNYDVKLYWRMLGETKWLEMVVKTQASSSIVAANIALRSLEVRGVELKGMMIEELK